MDIVSTIEKHDQNVDSQNVSVKHVSVQGNNIAIGQSDLRERDADERQSKERIISAKARTRSSKMFQVQNHRQVSQKTDEELLEEIIQEMGLDSDHQLTKRIHVSMREYRHPSKLKLRVGKSKRKEKSDEELLQEILEEKKPQKSVKIVEVSPNLTLIEWLQKSVVDVAANLTHGEYEIHFSLFMVFIILLAGVLVGIETYPILSTKSATALDWFIFSVFAVELVLNMIAEINVVRMQDSVKQDILDKDNQATADSPSSTTPLENNQNTEKCQHVLIVDDSALCRRMLIRIIQQNENNIFIGAVRYKEAVDGDEALQIMEVEKFDWVFLDNLMPNKCGPDAAIEMRHALRYHGPIIGIIGEASQENETISHFKKCGASEVLFKPVKRDNLIKVVELCKETALLQEFEQRTTSAVFGKKWPIAVRALWHFYTGPDGMWNTFDLMVVVFCIPIIPSGKGQASVVRLVTRLMRPAKVFRMFSMPTG